MQLHAVPYSSMQLHTTPSRQWSCSSHPLFQEQKEHAREAVSHSYFQHCNRIDSSNSFMNNIYLYHCHIPSKAYMCKSRHVSLVARGGEMVAPYDKWTSSTYVRTYVHTLPARRTQFCSSLWCETTWQTVEQSARACRRLSRWCYGWDRAGQRPLAWGTQRSRLWSQSHGLQSTQMPAHQWHPCLQPHLWRGSKGRRGVAGDVGRDEGEEEEGGECKRKDRR